MSDTDTAVVERPEQEPTKVQDNQFVTFSVSGEMFAVPMGPVQEIIRVPEVARLPLAPPSLAGLANLRGRVLPIVNLRKIFNSESREHDDATRALVIDIGQPLGFVVDRVSSVISVEAGEMEPATSVQSVAQADYLTGVIRRQQADGSAQLLLALDFEHLVRETFQQMRARASSGSSGSGASMGDHGATASAEAAAADELRLVSFTVADQEYAIDIADVQEIVQVPERITGLPNTPHHCLGVISLRQRLLPLVSLRAMFNLPMHELDEHHRIVVVSLPGRGQVGLVTDSVKEVLSVPRSQADSMPGILSRGQDMQEFSSICRLEGGKRLVSIIDSEKLLGMPAMQDVMQATGDPSDGTAGAGMNQNATAAAASDDDAQVVIFRLGAEEFGVPIMSVQEIVRVPESLTRVPKTPSFVEGVINLRGTVLPVIDQRVRLGMPAIERNDRQRIMVYTLGGMRTGFIVDSVAEVLRIPRGHIERSPELSDEQSRLITQVAKLDKDKRLVMLIEPGQLLGGRELGAMQSMMDGGSGQGTTLEQRLAA